MLMIRTLSAFVLVLGLGGFCFAEDKGANKLRSQKNSVFLQTPSRNNISESGPLWDLGAFKGAPRTSAIDGTPLGGSIRSARPPARTTTLNRMESRMPRANGYKLLFFSENGVKAPTTSR